LERLGVVDVTWATPMDDANVIELLPAGNGGSVVIDEAAFIDWTVCFMASDLAQRKLSKLEHWPEAQERHLFVALSLQTDWNVLQALSRDTRWLPSSHLQLPPPLSHLWLMEAPFAERCFLYEVERGWVDVDRHWHAQ
jgi:hypothetical protein